MTEKISESDVETNEPDKHSLMILNDDCLLQILEHVSLIDLTRLEQVNKRMHALSLIRWSRVTHLDFKTVFPVKKLNSETLRELLRRCGSSLTSWDTSEWSICNTDSFLRLLGNYCMNLKSLSITAGCINLDACDTLILFSRLESLKMKGCANAISARFGIPPAGPSDGLHSLTLGDREYTTNIRILHMDIIKCNLKCLIERHPHLEELLCLHLYSSAGEIRENKLSKLTVLRQYGDEPVLKNILTGLTELQFFSMTCFKTVRKDNFVFELPNLENLKELHLRHWRMTGEELIATGRVLNGQLTRVSLHGCYKIKVEDVARFLETQPSLEVLDVSSMGFSSVKLAEHFLGRPEEKPLTLLLDEFDSAQVANPSFRFVPTSECCWVCEYEKFEDNDYYGHDDVEDFGADGWFGDSD